MSTAYTKIKLKEPGEAQTLRVQRCAPATTGQFPGIEFYGLSATGEALLLEIGKDAADRQLTRLGLSYDQAVGKVLTFSRAPNPKIPSRPFWDISLASAQSANPTPLPVPPGPAKSLAPELGHIPGLPMDDRGTGFTETARGAGYITGYTEGPEPVPPEDATVADRAKLKFSTILAVHEECFIHSLKLAEVARSYGVEMNPESLSAMTAQTFIQVCK